MVLSSNTTIAKNTLFLYIRTFVLLLINLYTSRVILNSLGVEDFGIYTAVAGVVAMLSMITSPLSGAISRFLSFEIGRDNNENINKVFSTSVFTCLVFVIIVIIVLETIGLWFINEKMVIPDGRDISVNWVFQFALLSFSFQLVSIPYNAAIIAYEKMDIFAYIGILDSILKLVVAILISFYGSDRLVLYSILLAIESLIVTLFYYIYCKRKFAALKNLIIAKNGECFKKIFSYTGWQFFGGAASTLHIQGTNVLLNLYGGPIANAAQGIANQVNSAVLLFVSNFTTAFNPGIIKSYAAEKRERMFQLIYWGSRFSYYVFLFLAIPLLLETEQLLKLWLGQVPDHAVNLARLVILYSMIEALSKSIMTAINATGKIRLYQIVVGGIILLNIPISIVFLELGFPIEITAIVAFLLAIIAFYARLFICRNLIGLSIRDVHVKIIINILLVTVASSIVPIIIHLLVEQEVVRLILVVCTTLFFSSTAIIWVGCTHEERNKILSLIFDFIKRIMNSYDNR